jgi:hypothetical protein
VFEIGRKAACPAEALSATRSDGGLSSSRSSAIGSIRGGEGAAANAIPLELRSATNRRDDLLVDALYLVERFVVVPEDECVEAELEREATQRLDQCSGGRSADRVSPDRRSSAHVEDAIVRSPLQKARMMRIASSSACSRRAARATLPAWRSSPGRVAAGWRRRGRGGSAPCARADP